MLTQIDKQQEGILDNQGNLNRNGILNITNDYC